MLGSISYTLDSLQLQIEPTGFQPVVFSNKIELRANPSKDGDAKPRV